jgi:hypothetical protein
MQTTSRNADYNRLMDAARERARALRRQAISDAWTGAADAAGRALRAALRLVRGLARHERLRNRQPQA